MTPHRFPLRVVLAVTTGTNLATLPEVQGLLSHMTGTPLAPNQIPRAADVCGKYLRDQFGWLATMLPTRAQSENPVKLRKWLGECEKARGAVLNIQVLPGGAYHAMDPIVEFFQAMESQGAGLAGSDA